MLFSSFMVLYPGGAPAGYSGSPGDAKNCAQCHGSAATTATGWITSNIPAAGYSPGASYQITATNNISGSGKYGFEVSPQNGTGTLLGTLTAGTGSQLVGSGKYVTHSSSNNSTKTWTFTWHAPAAGTGNVTFYGAFARNYSGPTTLSTLVVSEQSGSLPAAAGPITGASSVCRNNSTSYSIAAVAGATSYVWSVPPGASITAGQGTTAVTVNYSSIAVSGNVSVYGSNATGNGSPGNLAITVNSTPLQPGAIAGNASPCQGSSQTYSVTNTSGVTYTWSVPTGSTITSGQGTNSITATMEAPGGNINVVPSNTCGIGIEQISSISVQLLPGIAEAISGPDMVDLAVVVSTDYTTVGATDATSYQWELSPVYAGTISGTGLTAIVAWNGSFLGQAQIRVKAINACGEGAWSVIKNTEVTNTTGITEDNAGQAINVYPSPSKGNFTVALKGINGKVKLRIIDTTGHELYSSFFAGEEATPFEFPLASGIYLLLVDEGSRILRHKLIIQ